MRLSYYLIVLGLNLWPNSLLGADTTLNNSLTSETWPTILTTEWLTKQQQNLTQAQTSLIKERQVWKLEGDKFAKQLETVEETKATFTEETLKQAAADKDTANKALEASLAERLETKNQLEKFNQALAEQQKLLNSWLSAIVPVVPPETTDQAVVAKSATTKTTKKDSPATPESKTSAIVDQVKESKTATPEKNQKPSPATTVPDKNKDEKGSTATTAPQTDTAKEQTAPTTTTPDAAKANSPVKSAKPSDEPGATKTESPKGTLVPATQVAGTPPDTAVQAAGDATVQVTPAQIEEVKGHIALLQRGIAVQTADLKVLEERYQAATNRLKFAIQWHDKINAHLQQQQLQDQQQGLQKMQTSIANIQDALKSQRTDLPNKIARLETTQVTAEAFREMLDQAALDAETTAIEIENSKLETQNMATALEIQQRNLQEQQQKLETLRKTAMPDPAQKEVQDLIIASFENNLKVQTQHLELDQQNLNLTKQKLEQSEKQLQLLTEWNQKLQAVYQQRQQQFLEAQVQQEQQQYFSQALEFRQQLEAIPDTAPTTQRGLLKIQIQQAKERAVQVKRRLQMAHVSEQLQQWQATSQQKTAEAEIYQTLAVLQNLLNSMGSLTDELTQLQDELTDKIQVFDKQLDVLKKKSETLDNEEATKYSVQAVQVLTTLTTSLREELAEIPKLQTKAEELQKQLEETYKSTLHQALFRVRQLPKDVAEWLILFNTGITPLPGLFWQQVQLTGQSLTQAVQQTTTKNWQIFSVLAFVWLLLLWIGLRWSSQNLTAMTTATSRSFAAYGSLLGLRLLQLNVNSILFTGLFLLLLWLVAPTSAAVMFILILVLGGLGIKLVINGILMFLADPELAGSFQVKRPWLIRMSVFGLGLLTMVTALIHVEQEGYALKLSLTSRDLIDTLFMLALLLIMWPLWQFRKLLLTQWQTHHSEASSGFLVSLFTLFIPLLVALVALLGLVGYINLGWNLAKHLSLLLLIIMGWLIISGIVTNLMNWWKRIATMHYRLAILWVDSLIPLVHKLVGLAVVVLAALTLAWLNGWYSDVAVQQGVTAFLKYSLLNLGEQPITIGNVLLSCFVLWIVFWISGWSRQVSYQWVYQNISDSSVKQSLSIFTQYTVMLVGLLVALKIIGVNLTTLTVFAGAIGVGIGFGLRDLINNFISGILLLIERPLRSGDLVNVANYYGKVGRIGIRSLTVETFENQAVVIPNSEVISRIFVNWTSHNTLRRITLNVNAGYETVPQVVIKILIDVLEQTPQVLTTPPFKVYVVEFTELAMKFRLDYFIDLKTTNFLQVSSNILSKIWERFKADNIHIPTQSQLIVDLTKDSSSQI